MQQFTDFDSTKARDHKSWKSLVNMKLNKLYDSENLFYSHLNYYQLLIYVID